MLGPKGIITDDDEMSVYNTDWTKRFIGRSKIALRPQSAEEVAEVLKYCNTRKLAVVP